MSCFFLFFSIGVNEAEVAMKNALWALPVLAAALIPGPSVTAAPAVKPIANCQIALSTAIELDRIYAVPNGSSGLFNISLAADQGIIVDYAMNAETSFDIIANAAVDAAADATMIAGASSSDPAMPDIQICLDGKRVAPTIVDPAFDDSLSELAYTYEGKRLSFLAGKAGTYVIDISPALKRQEEMQSSGPLELFVRQRAVSPMLAGEIIEADLSSSGGKWEKSLRFEAAIAPPIISFDGKKGQRVEITLKRDGDSDIDPYLRFATPSTKSPIDLNIDDSGLNDNAGGAKLVKLLTEDGKYRVQAAAFGMSGALALAITLDSNPAPLSTRGAPLKLGEAAAVRDGVFEFEARRGQAYTVHIQGADAETMTFVELLAANPIQTFDDNPYATLAMNDGTIAAEGKVLEFTANEKRKLFLRVTSFTDAPSPALTIRVDELE
jgi:hypothetical protein